MNGGIDNLIDGLLQPISYSFETHIVLLLLSCFYFYYLPSYRPPYLTVFIYEDAVQIIVPEPADQQRNHHFAYDENIIEQVRKRFLYPRNALDRLCQQINAPCVEANASYPNKEILDDDIFLFAVLRFEGPIVINEAIQQSAGYRTEAGCIDIINMKQLRRKNSYGKVQQAGDLRRELCPHEGEKAGFREGTFLYIFHYPAMHLVAIKRIKL